MISVIIPTLNEERDLPDCLASVAWSDDVHVFDSFSSDATIEIAKAAGARVEQRQFDNYASHRNAALALSTLRHEWVLFLDADERMTEALRREMLDAVRGAEPDVGAFRLRRRDYFMGRWLEHAQISPFYIRLFRRGAATYEREVNEVARVRGRIGDLQEHFDHFPFSKGLSHWVDKHNRYSTLEARCALATRRGDIHYSPWRAFFARDFN
jgi:glycosyltransferase involved in cell wall biosynthesis